MDRKTLLLDGRPLTSEEVSLIELGLDLITRVHLGQVTTVFRHLIYHLYSDSSREAFKCSPGELCLWAELLQENITGSRFGSPGIFQPGVSREARQAFRLLACLRGDKIAESMVTPEGDYKEKV